MGNSNHIENRHDDLKNKILKVSSWFLVPGNLSKESAWIKLETRLPEPAPKGKEVWFALRSAFKIAASLLIVAIASFTIYFSQKVSVSTSNAEFKTMTLPDNSTVILNAASSIEYNSISFYFNREVDFSGEGFFKVQKGSSFEVVSENGTTKVLGTQFNVIARKGKYEVACVEGKVKVNTKISSAVLSAGMQTKLLDDRLSNPQPIKEETAAWRQGEFYFENDLISEVFETLQLQFGVTIQYRGDANRRYTGYFTNKNLEEALRLVCLPLQLDYTMISNSEIKISEK